MMDPDEAIHRYQPGLTIGQVASNLKVSPSTVRRWVRSGRLPSTQVSVGDGFEYRIPVEAVKGVETSVNPSTESMVNSSTTPSEKGSATETLEASVERSTAVAAYNAQLLAPLVDVIERQSSQLVAQAEIIGELRATVAAQGARIATLEAPTSTEGQKPPLWLSRLPWRSWAVYGVAIVSVLALVIGAVLLVR